MADENDLKITIVADEDANVNEATKVKVDGETIKTEVKDPALQDLMAQYKELETRSADAERRAQEAEARRRQAENESARHKDEAETARKRETSSHLDTITTAISASEQDIESAKSAIRVAKAAQDVEAELEAIDRLTKARSTLLRLDEARQDIEARQKAPPPRKAPPNDPVEAFVQNRTPETTAWVRAHPQYVRSERGMRQLTAADAVAQAEDLLPDTPEYFARVEEYLGIGKKQEEPAVKAAPTEASQVQPKAKTSAPPVAPGSAVSGGNGGSNTSVTLTAREAAAAQDGTHTWNWNDPNGKFKKGDPIGVQEFARRKLAMQRQGMYDRSYEAS
jgi:hypothetical protein